tara:strand:+ start:102 stop:392 length:291 start_codon:yes stop_codon:yes gene_type:complete
MVEFYNQEEISDLLGQDSISHTYSEKITKIYQRTGESSMDNQALGFKAGRESMEIAQQIATKNNYSIAYRNDDGTNISFNENSAIIEICYDFYDFK